jgi:hypothetical protein
MFFCLIASWSRKTCISIHLLNFNEWKSFRLWYFWSIIFASKLTRNVWKIFIRWNISFMIIDLKLMVRRLHSITWFSEAIRKRLSFVGLLSLKRWFSWLKRRARRYFLWSIVNCWNWPKSFLWLIKRRGWRSLLLECCTISSWILSKMTASFISSSLRLVSIETCLTLFIEHKRSSSGHFLPTKSESRLFAKSVCAFWRRWIQLIRHRNNFWYTKVSVQIRIWTLFLIHLCSKHQSF